MGGNACKPTLWGGTQPGTVVCVTGLGYTGPPHSHLTLEPQMIWEKKIGSQHAVRQYLRVLIDQHRVQFKIIDHITLDFFFRMRETPTSPKDMLSVSSPAPLDTSTDASAAMATGGEGWTWTIRWPCFVKTCRRDHLGLQFTHAFIMITYIYPEISDSGSNTA